MTIQTVGIIGAGTMGNGIAQACAVSGVNVVMIDVAQAAVDKGLATVSGSLDRLIKKEKLTAEQKTAALALIKGSTNYDDLKGAQLVIEAATENHALKLKILKQVDDLLAPEVIIASNTSSISITQLAAATSRPDRFIGMHFFNPVPMMALVELIRGYLTTDATHDAVKALAEKLGKSPITVKNAPGFVVNRILVPMINEAFFVLSEGIATAEDIDAGMKLGCNQPIGPLALADMIGLDVCLAVMEVYLEQFGDSKYRPCRCSRKWSLQASSAARPAAACTRTDPAFHKNKETNVMTATPTNPPAEGCIDTQVLDHVLLIGINRPAKRNGWTPPMFKQLAEAYTRLDDDPALRVGVLHAFGDHFTAGLDLPAVTEYMKRGEKAIPAGLVEPHDFGLPDYRRRTKPMVVAVKGICFTVGIELMLGADIVVAADNCRFSQMEVQRGIMATGGATLRMAERAGVGNAMLHLLTADEFEVPRLSPPLRVEGGAGRAGARRCPGHCAAHRGAGTAGRGRHPAQCDQGCRARAACGRVGIHRNAEAPLEQRGRGRRRALFCRAPSCTFQRSLMMNSTGAL